MICQPSPGLPSICDAGTRTLSKKISVVVMDRRASVASGRIVRPGVVLGIINTDKPLRLSSALPVRTSIRMTVFFSPAPLHHSFWPSIT